MARILVETNASHYTEVALPQEGEVWLRVQTGHLYEMREWKGAYRACHRLGTPEEGYGCDPSVNCACHSDQVREGQWIRVLNVPGFVTPKRTSAPESGGDE